MVRNSKASKNHPSPRLGPPETKWCLFLHLSKFRFGLASHSPPPEVMSPLNEMNMGWTACYFVKWWTHHRSPTKWASWHQTCPLGAHCRTALAIVPHTILHICSRSGYFLDLRKSQNRIFKRHPAFSKIFQPQHSNVFCVFRGLDFLRTLQIFHSVWYSPL